MARRTGFGLSLDMDEVPPAQRVTSPDGKRVAGWWVGDDRTARDEAKTVYRIAVWDAASGERLDSYTRVHREDFRTRDVRGAPVVGVEWTSDGKLFVVFEGGEHEPVEVPKRVKPYRGPKIVVKPVDPERGGSA